jgi:hypothetical protein
MDRILPDDLQSLFLNEKSDWCVSLFLPTFRAGRETEQNSIRFKNLLRKAEKILVENGVEDAKRQKMLAQPEALLQDRSFWDHQSDGLAMFFSAEIFRFFRLPLTFDELTVVSTRFHVKPLLPIQAADGVYYVLTVSQNNVRLLECTQHSVEEVDLGDVPQNIEETIPDGATDKHLQFHTGTPSGSGSDGRAAVFHGQDAGNKTKARMSRWFRMIDDRVKELVVDIRSPLVLAGVDSLFSIYREASTLENLIESRISGNADKSKPEELRALAWVLVEPFFKKSREEAVALFRQLEGSGKTSTDLSQTLAYAHQGRIEILFVAVGVQVWGTFDPQTEKAEIHESQTGDDGDLLDLAAVQALAKGGVIFTLPQDEMPTPEFLAAILRY